MCWAFRNSRFERASSGPGARPGRAGPQGSRSAGRKPQTAPTAARSQARPSSHDETARYGSRLTCGPHVENLTYLQQQRSGTQQNRRAAAAGAQEAAAGNARRARRSPLAGGLSGQARQRDARARRRSARLSRTRAPCMNSSLIPPPRSSPCLTWLFPAMRRLRAGSNLLSRCLWTALAAWRTRTYV
jgi:hypothetical protein